MQRPTMMKRRRKRTGKEEIRPVQKNNHAPKEEETRVEQTYTVEVNERVIFTITAETKREAKRKARAQKWNPNSRMYLESSPVIRTVTLKS